jgi:hypothetical protein
MTPDELHALQEPDAQQLIASHAQDDPADFAMRFKGRPDLPIRAMAEQIACRKKAAQKLPSLSGFPLIYTRLALEQSSGESAAAWKASLMSGTSVIDLTGGLGIDSIHLARRFGHVVYCERDAVLAELAAYNRRALGITNIEARTGDCAEILAGFPDDEFDWLYVDPARREAGGRSIGLQAASPDVVGLHDLMLRKAHRVCIKASPALETDGLQEKLPALSSIIVVSVGGECKEILLMLERGHAADRSPSARAVCLGDDSFEIASTGGNSPEKRVAAVVGNWLYEPDAAIIKARLSAELAANLGLLFLNKTVDYLTSDRFVEHFPGRSFMVEECLPFKPKSFRRELDRLGISGAAIQRRDFPLSPDQIRKRFRLRESSETFLFFTRDASGALVWLICRKGEGTSFSSLSWRDASLSY